jgi:DNA-binding MurR/RpiR family transcriptional regulator
MYNDLTKAEQKIADYILQNSANVIHMTISELADASQSAEATIFRFCRKLNFVGFQGLKIALAGDLFSPERSVYQEVEMNDSAEVFAPKIFNIINEGLQDTLKVLDLSALEKAIDALAAARHIDAYGLGGSSIIAADIEHRFMRFGIPVRSYCDPHFQIASASLLQQGDVIVAISHSGASIELLKSVELAKKNQATVIAITSYMKSPITKIADICLHGMARETSYRPEASTSRIIHLALVDLLYTGVMLKKPEPFIENMNKVRLAISSQKL